MSSTYLKTNVSTDSQAKLASRTAKPFLKWAGGKQKLLAQYDAYFPMNFDRYFEPFVGGGAVFFHLWSTGRLFEKVFLFDHNEELVNAYQAVRDKLEELVGFLTIHRKRHSKEYYYQVRDLDRQNVNLGDVERAARTIYLNKTCYNGLYRVNGKGEFNVPMGSYKNPKILYDNVLRSANAALQEVCVEVKDFRDIVHYAQAGDFLYFDPPYDPVSKTASFTNYTAAGFGDEDQRDLAHIFALLAEKGCLCMLSNSYTPFVLDLYRKFRIETVKANRAINSNPNGRGDIQEVVVLNY